MIQNYRSFAAIGFFFVITLSAVSLQEAEGQNSPLLKDVTGRELQKIIASYQGEKAVLVNVWATWCAPCIEEFPDIVKIQRKYEDQLRVVFVSTDFPDSRDKALAFLKDHNVDWTTYFKTGSDEAFIEAISKEWTGAMPFTKILNKQGEVVARWENSASFSKFNKHVKRALNP